MTRIKLFLTLGALLIVSGCTLSNYYVLSTASQPTLSYTHTNQVIGVEKVTVPIGVIGIIYESRCQNIFLKERLQ